MRVVLADLKSDRGFVSKDTVVGGYGSRLDPFSRVTAMASHLKKQFHDVPSVHMAYLAAILTRAGHDVTWTRGNEADGDVALVLSSLVDYKNETAWADRDARARREGGVRRHHGVEDARTVRRSLRLHLQRRARSGRHAPRAGRRAHRDRDERADQRSRFAAVPALGSRDSRTAPGRSAFSGPVGLSAAGTRCSPAAAVRNSARTARTGFSPATAHARSRTSWTKSNGSAISTPVRT